jgi:uncharacterized RDD family membrane protein YckC
MTQGYGPEDSNHPGQGQPSYPPPPPYGPPAPGAYGQPGYAEAPGYYRGHQLASWLQRVGAFLIDLLAWVIPLVIALVILMSASGNSTTASGGAALIAFLLIVVSAGVWVYNRCILQGRTGQSWGKQALGLKLLRMDNGQPIGGGMSFAREFAHVLDGLPCLLLPIGYLWPLLDRHRQTFADKIINTVVIAD